VRRGIPLTDVFEDVRPFVVADRLVIAVLYMFPKIVTILSNTMFGTG
jgi:TRAP-type C4-dicarboxylate transport system permease large subunit